MFKIERYSSVQDAENMSFNDNSFDLICGTGILHHLQLNKALPELVRVLKPEGKAIFIEPLGYNPAINLFRRLTPGLRTKDEHPLKIKDLRLIKNYFHNAEFKFFHLFSLLAVAFRNSKIFFRVNNMLDCSDKKIFKLFPFTQILAWQVIMILSNKPCDSSGNSN